MRSNCLVLLSFVLIAPAVLCRYDAKSKGNGDSAPYHSSAVDATERALNGMSRDHWRFAAEDAQKLSTNGTNPSTPQQVHLALTGDPTTMAVSWWTPGNVPTVVTYEQVPTGSAAAVNGTTHTYWSGAGYMHDAILTGLSPGALYKYSCGDGKGNSSQPSTFHAAPVAGSSSNFTVAMYGDMGVENSGDTIKVLQNWTSTGAIDFVIHDGDISYADDFPPDQYESHFNTFMDNICVVANEVPYQVGVGNHEYPYNFTLYKNRFRMPGIESGSNTNLFFSFDYANVHFVAVSTEQDYSAGSVQMRWLVDDLQRASQKSYDWIIVYGHRPLYCTNIFYCGTSDRQNIIDAFEDLFLEYGVSVYLAGHVHAYERTLPIRKGRVSGTYSDPAGGIVHLIPGSPGCKETPAGCCGSWLPQQPWSAFHTLDYGLGKMTISASALEWSWYNNQGVRVDTITIERPSSPRQRVRVAAPRRMKQ